MSNEISLAPPSRTLACGHVVRVEQVITTEVSVGYQRFSVEVCPVCNPLVAARMTSTAAPTIRTAK